MKEIIKSYLNRMPYIKSIYDQVEKKEFIIKSLQEQLEKQEVLVKGLQEQLEKQEVLVKGLQEQERKQGFVPPGHYYSPIPSEEEVMAYINSRQPLDHELLSINLNKENQLELLKEYTQFYKDLPFPEKQEAGSRFFYENDWFSYSDAIFLFCFLRKHQPKKIIEIGSGFSSAVMLDTIDKFFSQRPEITCIEPHPERLRSLLRGNDQKQVKIIEKRIQEVPLEIFLPLQAGDLLFVDSSHVVKVGSDVEKLMFEILPLLPPGIFVHFHDIFYPFDYLDEWLKEGRYLNESYFLRAFLSYNCEWSIYLFGDYCHFQFRDFIKEKMPLCLQNFGGRGGSIYIQREQRG
jgi:predicted O-methyltransferase YrrM